jgi:hypothetical protein
MKPIRRLAAALAGLAGALLACAALAPAALAQSFLPRPPGWDKHPPLPAGQVTGPVLGPNRAGYPPISHVRTVVIGGMPGWQIALIAIGASLLAATVAVLLDRARTAAKLSRWPGRATPATPSAASAGQPREHDPVFPAAHDDGTRPAAAHLAALHPLPARPGGILGQPNAR